jgi:hypothetical protein
MIAVLVCTTGLLAAVDAAEESDPINTVLSFNSLITDRNADPEFTKLVADGVQFTLRSLHPGMNPETLTTDIVKHWSTVIPVVIATSSSYVRQVKILDTEVHGDVATVWTQTTTESTALNSDKKNINSFTEVYLLITTVDGWKIAAIADNRQATKLEAAQNVRSRKASGGKK